MVFWIFVILTVVCAVLTFVWDDWFEVFLPIGVITGMVVLFMIPFVIAANIGIDAKIAKAQARYDSLVYQYENDIYENDNDLGKRDLMEDIESWNTDLAYKKEIQDNFWVGIFYPDIYDAFESIELK